MAGQNNSNESKQSPKQKNQLTPYVEMADQIVPVRVLESLCGHF